MKMINKKNILALLFGVILIMIASESYLLFANEKFEGKSVIQGFNINRDESLLDINTAIMGLKGGAKLESLITFIEKKRNVKLSKNQTNELMSIVNSTTVDTKNNTVTLTFKGPSFLLVQSFLEDATEAIIFLLNEVYLEKIENIKTQNEITKNSLKEDQIFLTSFTNNQKTSSSNEIVVNYLLVPIIRKMIDQKEFQVANFSRQLNSKLTYPPMLVEKPENNTNKVYPIRSKVYKFCTFILILGFSTFYFLRKYLNNVK